MDPFHKCSENEIDYAVYTEGCENHIFNHGFAYSNISGDFPAGWQRNRGAKTADFYWEQDVEQNFNVNIQNSSSKHSATICQQRSYSTPVYEKQVWEVGAVLRVNIEISAVLKVNFISRSCSRILYSSLNMIIEPGTDYYYGIVIVPSGIDYALIEIGILGYGCLCIEDVVFKRVYPSDKYDMDARGRLNINTVSAVKKIIDPITVKGNFEFKKESRDIHEDVAAGPEAQVSKLQDVLNLSTYSFCVINQGTAEAHIEMQLSPNGSDWLKDDTLNGHIEAGQMEIYVSCYFLRYIRLKYWTESSDTTNLRIYFQGQG